MTWPQYRRRECRVVAALSPLEAELIATLLLRYPAPVSTAELIEAIYPDPDVEPDSAVTQIHALVRKAGHKIGRRHIAASPLGYRLVQRPADLRTGGM